MGGAFAVAFGLIVVGVLLLVVFRRVWSGAAERGEVRDDGTARAVQTYGPILFIVVGIAILVLALAGGAGSDS